MLLAWSTFKRIQDELKTAEDDSQNPLNKPDYVRYSALVRTWMMATLIGEYFQVDLSRENLPASIAGRLQKSLDIPVRDWFPQLYELVNEAVNDAMEYLTITYPDVEARNFFRQCHR